VGEYLEASYEGMLLKDKSFKAVLEKHFDPAIEKMDLIPQNIGRVLFNLFNNAFYSVTEKKKMLNGTFEPTITVSTRVKNNWLEISVRDNGLGIPEKILDKIYQPFFTTKPAGLGTGLGLSLSYDIITKGYGGEMMVRTEEGKYAEFIIRLPYHAVAEPQTAAV
ncbi:MAG: ATP-binding protein, partial [Bacteroidota bacterium]|nr:ATP-binding protein [Bacteroidota bacterium]